MAKETVQSVERAFQVMEILRLSGEGLGQFSKNAGGLAEIHDNTADHHHGDEVRHVADGLYGLLKEFVLRLINEKRDDDRQREGDDQIPHIL